MISLLAAIMLVQEAPPPIVSVPAPAQPNEGQACTILRKIAENTTRTFTINKFIDADLSQFRDGWQARKQEQWNQIICGNEAFGPLQSSGWRFTQNLTFRSGERFTQDASCP